MQDCLEQVGVTILYLSTSGQAGGAETALLALLEALVCQEPAWRLVLVLGENGPFAEQAANLGIEVRLLPLPARLASAGIATQKTRLAFGGLPFFRNLLRYRRNLLRLILEVSPEIVQSNGLKMHLLLASFSLGSLGKTCLRVCHLHDFLSRRPWARRLLKLFARRFECIVTNSESVALEAGRLHADARRVLCIHNGVSLRRFAPAGAQLDLDRLSGLPDAGDGVVRIALAGAFARWKGHHTFFRALSLLPASARVRAYVIGGAIYRSEGSQYTREALQAAARQLCPDVEVGFTGILSDMAEAYRAVDLVVHASTQPEPFGMVLIEAMACGKAVIASRGGGVSEIVADQVNGLLYTAGDAAMLAKLMEQLAADAELRSTLGRQGLLTVRERFQSDLMAARFSALYRSMLALRPDQEVA